MPHPDHHVALGDASRPAGATVLVLAGGDAPHPGLELPPADLVVAADSGADRAAALGLAIDVVVGDLDSVRPETLAAARATGARVEGHHPDKDATDVELALAVAIAAEPRRLVLVGGHGGRLDHALATMGALAAVAAPGRHVEAWMGPAQVAVVVDRIRLPARPGELVSLVPVSGAVGGIDVGGVRWPLRQADFAAGTTWGVSNEAVEAHVEVSVASGTLAVVRPHALDPASDRRSAMPTRPPGSSRPPGAVPPGEEPDGAGRADPGEGA